MAHVVQCDLISCHDPVQSMNRWRDASSDRLYTIDPANGVTVYSLIIVVVQSFLAEYTSFYALLQPTLACSKFTLCLRWRRCH